LFEDLSPTANFLFPAFGFFFATTFSLLV